MPLWLAADPLMLASKSASRRAVLQSAGIPIDIEPAEVDEREIEARAGFDDPGRVAALLATVTDDATPVEVARFVAFFDELSGRLDPTHHRSTVESDQG